MPDECELFGNDCNNNQVLDECDIAANRSTKLMATDKQAGDRFGTSVSLSGNTAVIGSFGDDDEGLNSGSAYIFRKTAGVWQQIAKLTAGDAAGPDHFGFSVAVSGNTAVIGAYQDGGTSQGSAYIFREVGSVWQQIAKLTADDAVAHDQFGFSVAISGDTVLIGAHMDDDDQGGMGP